MVFLTATAKEFIWGGHGLSVSGHKLKICEETTGPSGGVQGDEDLGLSEVKNFFGE